jgi:hypothetical protein
MSLQINSRPYVVGHYWDGVESQFLPLSRDEMDRTEWFYRRILDRCGIAPRTCVLLISEFVDGALTAPLEQAMMADGHVPCYAEATTFDAPRVETFLRRFDIPAVIGVTAATLDGLEAAGHSPDALFAGRIVWARDSDAFARLADVPGITLRRWMQIGPAPAMECIEGGGLHIDSLEWKVETGAGDEILLTSRMGRIKPIERGSTGVFGRIETGVCRCGSCDPRVVPV